VNDLEQDIVLGMLSTKMIFIDMDRSCLRPRNFVNVCQPGLVGDDSIQKSPRVKKASRRTIEICTP